ncbi:MAG: hypothetical protein FWH41_04965 [Treponema sp.]|nr:hypothetical protein [Treponema sp.]
MLRKRFFGTIALIVGLILVFYFAACDDNNGDNGDKNGNGSGVIDDDLVLPAGYAWIIGTSPNRSGLIFNVDGTFLNVVETPPTFQT